MNIKIIKNNILVCLTFLKKCFTCDSCEIDSGKNEIQKDIYERYCFIIKESEKILSPIENYSLCRTMNEYSQLNEVYLKIVKLKHILEHEKFLITEFYHKKEIILRFCDNYITIEKNSGELEKDKIKASRNNLALFIDNIAWLIYDINKNHSNINRKLSQYICSFEILHDEMINFHNLLFQSLQNDSFQSQVSYNTACDQAAEFEYIRDEFFCSKDNSGEYSSSLTGSEIKASYIRLFRACENWLEIIGNLNLLLENFLSRY
ncbi:hypothetical protein H312_01990 [Anncaliia algerae PRA339]|uniref:Uncharacterized protein n=1 Tax=Anncaliia algerae PRA339 TaxID=1288291 RepID=A0A059F0E0_9MICR|nr:hypothetical protein H312_01990 [Anncaliia algerae PRA339]